MEGRLAGVRHCRDRGRQAIEIDRSLAPYRRRQDPEAGAAGGKQPDAYSANGNGVGVSSQELLNALLGSAKPVSGSWGSGTLVSTSLVSMLITNGEVYIGAVEPSVLYAAVGHASS